MLPISKGVGYMLHMLYMLISDIKFYRPGIYMAVAANNQSENVLYGIIIQRYNERI